MSSTRILVAGVGNMFLSDDGFGAEVARRLAGRPLPEGVTVADFGIRGLHLAYELLDGYDLLILVDAVSRGDAPGTITLIEADPVPTRESRPDAHDMDPAHMLALLADLGGSVDRMLIVGCEPAVVAEGIGLSSAVAAAVEEAIGVVEDLVHKESALAGKER